MSESIGMLTRSLTKQLEAVKSITVGPELLLFRKKQRLTYIFCAQKEKAYFTFFSLHCVRCHYPRTWHTRNVSYAWNGYLSFHLSSKVLHLCPYLGKIMENTLEMFSFSFFEEVGHQTWLQISHPSIDISISIYLGNEENILEWNFWSIILRFSKRVELVETRGLNKATNIICCRLFLNHLYD